MDDGLSIVGGVSSVETVSGPELVLRPLGLEDWESIRVESLKYYRREKIRAWTENLDLFDMSDEERAAERRSAIERAASIEYHQIEEREVIEYAESEDFSDTSVRREDRKVVRRHFVEYGQWWMAKTTPGVVFALWLSARRDPSQERITREEVEARFMQSAKLDDAALMKAADDLGQLTKSKLAGKSEASEAGPKELTAKEKRAERRRRRRKRRS